MSAWKTRLLYNPLRQKNQKRGVALLLAVTSLMLMVWVATEVSVDSTLEYVVNSQEINRIKAYYGARNSADIALLRIKAFQQISKYTLPPGIAQEVDKLWQFSLSWPLPVPPTASGDSIADTTKEALYDGQWVQSITDEGSKIDINDLASPSTTLREVSKKQLLNIFEQRLTSDDKFKEDYQNFRFEEFINRIADWMSDKNTSLNGGDKRSAFSDLGEGYPPNRGFRTVDELRLVPGMTEEFFSILSPQITVYGMKAINPNNASELVLKSLDAGITDEAIKEAVARRSDSDKGGPFKGTTGDECRNDFKSFIESRGARLSAEFDKIPFLCDKIMSFRIEATGRSGSGKGAIQKKIVAVVMDINKAALQIRTYVDKEKAASASASGAATSSGPRSQTAAQEPLPKGRPRIVYWSEI